MKRIFYFILSSLFLIPFGYGMDTHSASALERELIQAAKSGDLARVQALIAHAEVNINATDEDTATALHCAASNGHKEVVKLLLEKGADIDTEDESNYTPLHSAAHNGYPEVVKLLLQKGVSINSRVEGNEEEDEEEEGCTALHLAAELGRIEVVELLLQEGADVNAINDYHQTALHLAAESSCEQEEIVRLLLEKGAHVNAKDIKNRNTALHLAARRGYAKVVELLLQKGAKSNVRAEEGNTPLEYVVSYNWASKDKKKKVVEILLAFGAKIPEELALHPIIVQAQKDQTQIRTVKSFKAKAELLRQGIYACSAVRELVDVKRQLILEAVKYNNVEKVKALLKKGFSINTCGKDGNNLLHIAIAHKSHNVLALLVYFCSQDNKNVWDKKNSAGLTPMHVALAQSNFEALKIMLNISKEYTTADAPQTTGSKRPRKEHADLNSK